MFLLKRVLRAAAGWATANPVKAAQLIVAVIIVSSTLATQKRLDKRTLKRVARVFL